MTVRIYALVMRMENQTHAQHDVVGDRCGVMTSPHEETWTAHKDCVVMVDGWRTVFVSHEDMGPEPSRERAQLAAQAPAMARALLKVEWSGRQDYVGDGGYDCCSCCGGIAPGQETMMDARDDLASGKTVVGHRAECELDAAVRKAGVR